MDRRGEKALVPLYLASSVAGGLGLLIPFVALALVLAYAFGHVHGALRLFFGYTAVTCAAMALARAMRLGQMLRVGKLKIGGTIVQRLEAPRRFWTWVALEGLVAVPFIFGAIFLAWATLQWPAPPS